jgi:hypothetical protein
MLEASGIDDDEEDSGSFDEKIRQLVLAALAGKDVEKATWQAERSILEAKAKLEQEEANINDMLGNMEGAEYVGPRAPKFPPIVRSMEAREFALAAFKSLGAHVTQRGPDLYLVEEDGGHEWIHFDERGDVGRRATLYVPGSAAFSRLVSRMIASGVHQVVDADEARSRQADEISRSWVESFGGRPIATKVDGVRRCFDGRALARVRATVAHDSYERLVDAPCAPGEHRAHAVRSGPDKLADVIENAQYLGIDTERLSDVAGRDPGIAEFCLFYLERRAQETAAAGDDARKRKKLEDDFTPRLELTIVALEGTVHREVTTEAQYRLGETPPYSSHLTVVPCTGSWIASPELGRCESSGSTAPKECLDRCAMTGAQLLRHLLVSSELSGRPALPEHTLICILSGKRILLDEAEISAVSGKPVTSSLLKTSALTGKRAEPEHFWQCDFSGAEALNSELAVSDISGKRYRLDQQMRSAISGRTGHKTEFLLCHETRQPMTFLEAERCQMTGKFVRPGVLERCGVTGKTVLPSELERCAVTGKRVLKNLLVTSSVSGARLHDRLAVRSIAGKYCAPAEAKTCMWSGRHSHPDDIRICGLTGIPFHVNFGALGEEPYLQPLSDLLYGMRRPADAPDCWDKIASQTSAVLHGRCRIEASRASPDKRLLAICSEVRTLLGLRVHQAGLLYSLEDGSIVGRIAIGKRTPKGWIEAAG